VKVKNFIITFISAIALLLSTSTISLAKVVGDKIVLWLRGNPKTINTISACVLIVIALIIVFTQKY